MELIYDYKHNTKYRKSFNELAIKTFGIDFENWYQKGYWNENYVCYSYVERDKVIANISINFMDIIINGENKKAIQIATVMTDKDYRKQGLAQKLMNTIINKYEKEVDFFYLSANETVLNFYPKFGFKLVEEASFVLPVDKKDNINTKIKQLDLTNKEDLNLLLQLEEKRQPLSKKLGTRNDQHILMFYCTSVFRNIIYYLEDDGVIVIYSIEDDVLHLYDVISLSDINLKEVVYKIINKNTKKVKFYFTPDIEDRDLIYKTDTSNDRFIRATSLNLPKHFVFPQISQT